MCSNRSPIKIQFNAMHLLLVRVQFSFFSSLMAHFALAVAKTIGSGGAWVIGSKLFGHGLDRSSRLWKKVAERPKGWQQVTLNIGGVVFPTSRKTLLSSPKLSTLLHNKYWSKSKEAKRIAKDQFWHEVNDNEFFIDRDPTHFRYILNYIRTNKQCALPDDPSTRKELVIEADFYELHDLVTLLNDNGDAHTIHEHMNIPSDLITKEEGRLLRQWIQENDGDSTDQLYAIDLLYRASDHDFSASSFHNFCDNKGKTLVIIQAENGYIFGGYTHASWKIPKYKRQQRTDGFIFLLRSYGNDGEDQLRKWHLDTINNEIESELQEKDDCGPCFADSITILDECNATDMNEAYVGALFEDAPKEKETLSGTVNFRVLEYEVYQVSKLYDYRMLKYY
eukprot:533405_1